MLRHQESLRQANQRLESLAELRGRQRPTVEWFNATCCDGGTNQSSGGGTVPSHRQSHSSSKIADTSSQPSSSDTMTVKRSKSEQTHRTKPLPLRPIAKGGGGCDASRTTGDDAGQMNPGSHRTSCESAHTHSDGDSPADELGPPPVLQMASQLHVALDESTMSDMTDDFDSAMTSLAEFNSNPNRNRDIIRKKKKKGVPVWKLKPIEVRPYVPVPSEGN